MLGALLHAALQRCLYRLGLLVAGHPAPFLVAPALLAALLGAALSRVSVESKAEDLFAPAHSLAKLEGALADELFPLERSRQRLYSELHTPGRYTRLIAVARGGGNVLDEGRRLALISLHSALVAMPVGRNCTFWDVCSIDWDRECVQDAIVELMGGGAGELGRRRGGIGGGGNGSSSASDASRRRSSIIIRYPKARLRDNQEVYIGHQLGGVTLFQTDRVLSARALQITYYLDSAHAASELWEREFVTAVERARHRHAHDLALFPFTSSSLQTDFYQSGVVAAPNLAGGFALAMVVGPLLVVATATMVGRGGGGIGGGGGGGGGGCGGWWTALKNSRGRTRSEDLCFGLLVLAGFVGIALTTLATAGVMILTGTPYNSTLIIIPLVALGHGSHGATELLWTWRRLGWGARGPPAREEERLAATFARSLLPHTMLTALQVITLALGASPLTNTRAVQVFCRCACTATALGYCACVTFLGACVALAGKVRALPPRCWPVPSATTTTTMATVAATAAATAVVVAGGERVATAAVVAAAACGGVESTAQDLKTPRCICEQPDLISSKEPPCSTATTNTTNTASTAAVTTTTTAAAATSGPHPPDAPPRRFMRDRYGPWISGTYVKPFVVLLYLVYASFSFMGCLQLREASDLTHLVASRSATARYRAVQDRFFSDYSPVIGFYIYEPVAYWNASVQEDLLDITRRFVTVSWLEQYTRYLRAANGTSALPRDLFVSTLCASFLRRREFAHFADDVVLAGPPGERRIAASRVFMVAKTNENTREEIDGLLEALRKLSLTSRVKFTIHNPAFAFLERYALWVGAPAHAAALAAALALLLSAGLAPPGAAPAHAWVALCAASVQFGVLGSLGLMGAQLDCAAVLCLVYSLCYSAHACAPLVATFAMGRGKSRAHWTAAALDAHAAPLLHACLWFCAAVVALAAAPSNLARTVARCLGLASALSAVHCLVFLPVFLTICPPSKAVKRRRQAGDGEAEEGDAAGAAAGATDGAVDQATSV
uniref:Patched domain-containing protein 1 n=1 Tax=Petromyzon marinus TaxID=7757 RepID=A0AAJ7XBQ7_PETMA|nr:patched domain-containing protein 1 [Petromyzon marinus]